MATALLLSLLFCGSVFIPVQAVTGKYCYKIDLQGDLNVSDSRVTTAPPLHAKSRGLAARDKATSAVHH